MATIEERIRLASLSEAERLKLLADAYFKNATVKPTPPQRQRFDTGDTPTLPAAKPGAGDYLQPIRQFLKEDAANRLRKERNGG